MVTARRETVIISRAGFQGAFGLSHPVRYRLFDFRVHVIRPADLFYKISETDPANA